MRSFVQGSETVRERHLISGLRLVVRSTFIDHLLNLVDLSALLADTCDVVEKTLGLVVNLWC